ncbi:MAG: Holliday junction resolvase Hjc [Candidatus Woesearchaeota archaeon]|nr:Holliday junction resolvase Hjc [Candidatus Woesearchaeota archaeon]
MGIKAKGTNAERELIHMFWNNNWAAIRVAGSGSSRYPCPDVLAGDGIRTLAIECKSIKGSRKYIPLDEINNLMEFAKKFGAEPWIGVRFDNVDWFFLSKEDMIKTEKSLKFSLKNAKRLGLLFEELIQ